MASTLWLVLAVQCGGSTKGPPATPAPPTAAPLEPPLANGIYVSPTGDDAGPGAQAQPLRSIEAGQACGSSAT